jgi:outer membrane protein assembly factor BamB
MWQSPNKNPEEWRILTDWVEEIGTTYVAQDQRKKFFLGGLTPEEKAFFVAGDTGRVDKRSTFTGEPVWTAKLDAPSHGTWTVKGDSLYGGDIKGNIYRILLDDASIVWKTNSKGVVFAAPLVSENQLWVMNSYGNLQSFRAENGEWLWQQKDPAEANMSLWSAGGPLMYSNWVITGFPSGALQAFEPGSGSRVWTETFSLAVQESIGLNDLKSLATEGEYLVASSFSGDVKAWQATSGSKRLLWQKKLSLHTPATFEKGGETVYLPVRDGKVMAVEMASGYAKWTFELPSGLPTPVTVGTDYLWLGSSEGTIFVLDKSGNLIAKTRSTDSAYYNAPLLLSDTEVITLTSKAILRRMQLMKVY